MTTPRTEEYLESLFKLQDIQFPVSISRLAAHLGLSAASASEMAKKLRELGLVSTKGKKVYLTKKGHQAAVNVVRRHRLLERFLADFLEIEWDKVHDEACKLEHALSPSVEEKLAEKLGNPLTCPHGHPIPNKDGTLAKITGISLSGLEVGEKGVITGVPEESSQTLKYLAELGLKPGAQVGVKEKAPSKGPLLIEIRKSRHALSFEIASQILIKEVSR